MRQLRHDFRPFTPAPLGYMPPHTRHMMCSCIHLDVRIFIIYRLLIGARNHADEYMLLLDLDLDLDLDLEITSSGQG